jgi:hypothetical protein
MLQSVGGFQESILSVIVLELVGFRDWPNITLHTSTHASSPHLTSLFVRDKGDLLVPKCKYRRIYEYKSTNTDAFCSHIAHSYCYIYVCRHTAICSPPPLPPHSAPWASTEKSTHRLQADSTLYWHADTLYSHRVLLFLLTLLLGEHCKAHTKA